jgi:hypothetical protein
VSIPTDLQGISAVVTDAAGGVGRETVMVHRGATAS